jgi:hypothetical protein
MIKKAIGVILILLGLFFLYKSLENTVERKKTIEILENGKTVIANVTFVDCDHRGKVKFQVQNSEKVLEYYLDSDCSIFSVGMQQKFVHLEKYPNTYLFPNERRDLFLIVFSLIFGLIFLISGSILFKSKTIKQLNVPNE